MDDYRSLKAVNLQRYAVLPDELLFIAEGFAMVCECAELIVDGFITLNGELRVGVV